MQSILAVVCRCYFILICLCSFNVLGADPMMESHNRTDEQQTLSSQSVDEIDNNAKIEKQPGSDFHYKISVEQARKRWKNVFEEIKSFDLAEGKADNGTSFFEKWKLLLDGTKGINATKSKRQRFDGFATWEKKLQQWADDISTPPLEKNVLKGNNETTISIMSSLNFSPRIAKPGEAILPHTDISDKSKNIWIVTTASLPWMTGTAVNPLLRAAYLSSGRAEFGGSVTLMVPWLELESDRESIYGKNRVFGSPEEQEEWIRTWLRDTADLKQASEELNIKWYMGRVEKLENSVYSMGDITALLPENEVDICVLEEPEHLNWYRAPGESWTKKFKHVVGIVHTNYFVYAQEQPAALIRAPGMRLLCSWMCRAHCHRIIKLSGTLDQFAPEKELVENVHGCRQTFLDHGIEVSKILKSADGKNHPVFGANAEPKVYFIGKMLWSKGLIYLMELLTYAEESAGLTIDMDMYGGGPDFEDAKAKSVQLGLSMAFHGPIDHGALGESQKIFINPSLSEVLCTTVTEALAMGKFVIVPSHPSNDFFSQFPNCLTYANKEEFVGNLYYALTHSPEPLTKEYLYALSWGAANERFAAAGCISVSESEEFEAALDKVESGVEIDLPPLIEDETRRKRFSTRIKRTRSRFRQFRSELSQEIRDSNVLPNELQHQMIKELDKRLDVDLDELLESPKLKLKLSPAELDKGLLELYNNISDNPGGDVFRIIGGGANVGRQKYYMKQQAMTLKRFQQQQKGNIEEKGPNAVPILPEFVEDVGTGALSSSVNNQIKASLKRNFVADNTAQEDDKDGIQNLTNEDTPTMSLHGMRQRVGSPNSYKLYSIPRNSFVRTTLPFRSRLTTTLI